MDIRRKIGDEIVDELEELMEDAEDLGFNFIELRHGKQSKYPMHMRGRESLALISNRVNGTTYRKINGSKIISDGSIRFYPDNKARCWGYMLDTESNRKYLAGQLIVDHVIIADKKIKAEIVALATELKLGTKMIKKDHTMENYLSKKDKKPDEVKPVAPAVDGALIGNLLEQIEALKVAAASTPVPVEPPTPVEPKKVLRKAKPLKKKPSNKNTK